MSGSQGTALTNGPARKPGDAPGGVGHRVSWLLIAAGLTWPYLVVSALAAGYALDGFGFMTLDLPDPPWWSVGAFVAMACGLIPLGLGIDGRLAPDRDRLARRRKWLLWTAGLAALDAAGFAVYMALLNVALSLPLA